ncbi:neutral/alkaline non-lysosomal ceramidase N-terminal domain-containing protein [Paenibacillus sp. CC-CFT747]|nr:neutral/alkaline non-lysosomal ceramidase N-terminal domain-containing protein [Paenibacillus sp. CC-CFT747]
MPVRLKLGTSKIDITPSHPVPLAGFAVRSGLGPCTEVSYPLYARIYVLETEEQPEPVAGPEEAPEPGERIPEHAGMPERAGDASEAGRGGRAAASRAVLISADLIWWGSDRVPAFKEAVRRRFGLEPEAVLLHGTHTHSGPQTSALFTSYLGLPDPIYLDDLEERVLKGIGEALAGLEPVRVESGAGTSSLAVNRRGHRVRPPERRETDRELSVIRFVREDGSPKGILVHYACHPVITDENKVSPDFVGVAMGAVEEKYGKDVVCGFLQGTCGDINPGHDMTEYRGGHELVMQAGLSFARDIREVLDGPMEVRRTVPLRWRSRTVPLALAPCPKRPSWKKEIPPRRPWRVAPSSLGKGSGTEAGASFGDDAAHHNGRLLSPRDERRGGRGIRPIPQAALRRTGAAAALHERHVRLCPDRGDSGRRRLRGGRIDDLFRDAVRLLSIGRGAAERGNGRPARPI